LNPCGGVTVSCLDRPTIELTLRTGSDIVPNLYDLVRNTVDDVVAGLLVVPNGIAVPIETMGQPTDAPLLRHPGPKGILRVTLAEVTGTQQAPVSSPYVSIGIGVASWSSPVASPRQGPSYWASADEPDVQAWSKGNVQDFEVYSPNQSVDIRCFQSDLTMDLDVLLGRTKIPVHELAHGISVEVPLQSSEGEDTGRRLHVKGDWLAVCAEPAVPVGDASTLLASASLHGDPRARSHTRANHRTKHNTVGAGDVELMASLRVDSIEGLPSDPALKYSLRLSTGTLVEESAEGRPRSLPIDQVSDERLAQLAGKLSPLLGAADLADVLGVAPSLAAEFAQRHASSTSGDAAGGGEAAAVATRRGRTDTCAWQKEWCRRAREQAKRLAASSAPQFGRIFHMPLASSATLELEVVRHREGSHREESVARLTCEPSKLTVDQRLQPAISCQGPFALMLADGSRGKLCGSIELRHLDTRGPFPIEHVE